MVGVDLTGRNSEVEDCFSESRSCVERNGFDVAEKNDFICVCVKWESWITVG